MITAPRGDESISTTDAVHFWLVQELKHATKSKTKKVLKARVMQLQQEITASTAAVDDFGEKAKTAFARAIAKGSLKSLAEFCFGLLATTADGGERIKLKLLIKAISGKGVGHGGCLV